MKDAVDVPRLGVDGGDLAGLHADEVGGGACGDRGGCEECGGLGERDVCARGGGGVANGVSSSR